MGVGEEVRSPPLAAGAVPALNTATSNKPEAMPKTRQEQFDFSRFDEWAIRDLFRFSVGKRVLDFFREMDMDGSKELRRVKVSISLPESSALRRTRPCRARPSIRTARVRPISSAGQPTSWAEWPELLALQVDAVGFSHAAAQVLPRAELNADGRDGVMVVDLSEVLAATGVVIDRVDGTSA